MASTLALRASNASCCCCSGSCRGRRARPGRSDADRDWVEMLMRLSSSIKACLSADEVQPALAALPSLGSKTSTRP